MDFITKPEELKSQNKLMRGEKEEGHTTAPTVNNMMLKYGREKRTKKILTLMTPSIHAQLTEIAEEEEVSVNEVINVALISFIEAYRSKEE